MVEAIMKQLSIMNLMWQLFKKPIRYGNLPVYYHIAGGKDYYNCPLEVEGLEIRTSYEKKLTIW